ncbi:MAG: HlyD family efflux transporter periplasmic adaptor subunit [Geminicoccaceae bacterium]|jgi:HlyD family secretion protein|nr:HlyD family efflux transporter periplasmic adaptor subunit [Geminicoccaceae bacterium]MCB9966023.1 HlyD family efflux transporter periplasmic adaptor subunit [Geminicoccaceae bacterium]HRY24576.1 HlyD family efflux transporter periplasmic adaptor subunit [Geminicoccaceae bacterium]
MKRRILRVLLLLVVIALTVAGGHWWLENRVTTPPLLTGYVEGEALYLAGPMAAELARLDVDRGDRVAAGQSLFVIDQRAAEATLEGARAAAAAAQARVEDARKGMRAEEMAVIEAERDAAKAQLEEAKLELDRVRPLVERGATSRARLDEALANYRTADAQLAQVMRQLDAAQLGARADLVAAAEAEAERAQAAVDEAEVLLAQLAVAAPAAGLIENVFFRAGEWVPASQPVLSLLPDERVKIRFFVPQAAVATYRTGGEVTFTCDGCGAPRAARITFVSPRVEYTPPVIYSQESREKLVFLIEAEPVDPAGLAPGQPVDVTPLGP